MTASEAGQTWVPFWEQLTSVADHGYEMVAWLQGARSGHPGYRGPPDPETAELTPYLIALNTSGLVTVGSQPSASTAGSEQRAFLEAYGEPALVQAVVTHLRSSGLKVDSWPTAITSPAHWDDVPRTIVTRTPLAALTHVGRWSVQDVLADLDKLTAASSIHQDLLRTMSMTAYDPCWPDETNTAPHRLFKASCEALGQEQGNGAAADQTELKAMISEAFNIFHPFPETWEEARAAHEAGVQAERAGLRIEHHWLSTHKIPTTTDPLGVLGPVLRRLQDTSGTPRPIGCASGWHRLISTTDRHLTELDPNYPLWQVKEKFGLLAFAAAPSTEIRLNTNARQRFDAVIKQAEIASQFLCEVCGRADAVLRGTPPRRIRTLCNTHAAWGVQP